MNTSATVDPERWDRSQISDADLEQEFRDHPITQNERFLLRLLDAERARADAAEDALAAIQPAPTPPHWPARAATDPDGTVQYADLSCTCPLGTEPYEYLMGCPSCTAAAKRAREAGQPFIKRA